MFFNLSLPANYLTNDHSICAQIPNSDASLPIYVGRFSYMVGTTLATVVYEKDCPRSAFALHIGAFCSIADNNRIVINEDHDFLSVTTSVCNLLDTPSHPMKIREKGSVIIQNDVWIGQNVTIYGGVTIHNGAVVAGNSVVTKDVPPYAIVGGNPAKVIKYRFDADTIQKLQEIRWWDWSNQLLEQRKHWFHRDIHEFVAQFYPEAEQHKQRLAAHHVEIPNFDLTYLMVPDFNEPYAIWKKIILDYCAFYQNHPHLFKTVGMILVLKYSNDNTAQVQQIEQLVQNIDAPCELYIHCGSWLDCEWLFSKADFFITSRRSDLIRLTTLADLHHVPILSGVDVPILFSL